MIQLTMGLQSSAEMLGADPKSLLVFLQQKQLGGVVKLNDDWRISVFTLAQVLNTTPSALLDVLEDYELGQMIEAVEDDEFFEADEGQQVYQHYLAKA